MGEYNRTLDELRAFAVLSWPRELLNQLAKTIPLYRLLSTQDKFLSLLKLNAEDDPFSWLELLSASGMEGNLFLKHLMLLSDLGGEALNKLTPLEKYFPDGVIAFNWQGKDYRYTMTKALGKTSLTNGSLKVDGKSLILPSENTPTIKKIPRDLTGKAKDVAVLIMFAGLSTNVSSSFSEEVREKAVIGKYLSNPEGLDLFVKQNYIRVNRQITGANSNSLGQIAQDYVLQKLSERLGTSWTFRRDGTVPRISHNDRDLTTFDVVAKSPSGKYFAIEVSFQVTTNSVIERKAGQAQARQALLKKQGHNICYVLDGAGNINVRKNAVGTICRYSDCTVAFSEAEIAHLATFMQTQA